MFSLVPFIVHTVGWMIIGLELRNWLATEQLHQCTVKAESDCDCDDYGASLQSSCFDFQN
jgi:hypothetical protein